MQIRLERACAEDMPRLWRMQICAFKPLLEKYGNESSSPACETLETVMNRFHQPCSDYYMIYADEQAVGGLLLLLMPVRLQAQWHTVLCDLTRIKPYI